MREDTPSDRGFFLPPEWHPHRRSWLAWPSRLETWRDRFDNACYEVSEIVRAVARFEPLTVLAPEASAAAVRLQLGAEIEVLDAEAGDSWLRDHGPTFLIDGDGASAGVCWGFNGWGNKVHDVESDAEVSHDLVEAAEAIPFEETMVLEGSAIDVDAVGTLLTTESVLMNDNRNPTLDQRQIEERLVLMLGAGKVIWLRTGLQGDGRNGQLTPVARFAGPATLLCAMASEAGDPDAADLHENRQRLAEEKDSTGRPFEIIEVPVPAPRRDAAGRRMPLSYLGFVFVNGALILPSFDDPLDQPAAALFAELFPEREVVAVPALELAMVGGSLRSTLLPQPGAVA